MKVKAQEYAQLLYKLLSQNKDAEIVISNFLLFLKDNCDLGKIENIIKAFEDYYQDAEGVTIANIETARPLNEDSRSALVNYIKRIKPLAKKVILKEKVEPKVMGGIKIIVDDVLIDATTKKQLINLKNILIQ